MKKNGFMEGAIIATIAIIISKVLGLLYVIPFYKIIGEEGGSLYGYAYNIYNIFLIISSAGIPLAISKLTSEYVTKKEDKKKENMYNISLLAIRFFSLFSFIICFCLSKQIAKLILGNLNGINSIDDVAFVIKCISFALLIVPTLSISRGYLQGHNYIAASSFSQVIEQIVRILTILIGSFIAYKVLHLPLVIAVGISVFSACIGAIAGYIYLLIKMKKIKPEKKVKIANINKEEKSEIIKKIIGYSLPFIIVNIANNLYNTTDMILVIRGLKNVGYNPEDIELISSIFTTWAEKLGTLIKAFATGMTISLIPTIVSSFVKKNIDEVNSYFNTILKTLLVIILPISIFFSIYSKQIWSIFYGNSFYGPIIFKYTVLVVILDCAYILIGSALQGLNKTKLIYSSVFLGLITNLILDLPLMYLFNKLGLYPFFGAITSTVIGYCISIGIPLYVLYKKYNFNYSDTIKLIPKIFISIFILVLLNIAFKHFITMPETKLLIILYLLIIGSLSGIIYLLINYKEIIKIINIKFKKTHE